MKSSPEIDNIYYKYELIRKIWRGNLKRNFRKKIRRVGEDFFDNFIEQHPSFKFSIVRIFDGTTHVMLDSVQYMCVKEELEEEIGGFLPEVTDQSVSIGMKSNSEMTVLENKRVYSSQHQLDRHLRDLKDSNEIIYSRAYENAAKHTSKLCRVLSEKNDAKFLSIYIGADGKDRKTILEVGLVKFTLKEGDKPEYFHAIVDDNQSREGMGLRDGFQFGPSVRMSLEAAAEHLQKEIAGADFLVTHMAKNNLKYLADNDITITGKILFDTQILALNLLPEQQLLTCWGLKSMLGEIHVKHEGGLGRNDAHYTMLAFKGLARKAILWNVF